MIKMDFEVETKHGKYRDALYLPEGHTHTMAEIEAMKQERVDNWITAIENPPVIPQEPEYIEVDGVKYMKVQ